MCVSRKNVNNVKSIQVKKIQRKSDFWTLRLSPAYEQRPNSSSPLVSEDTSFESKSVNDVAPMGLWKNFTYEQETRVIASTLNTTKHFLGFHGYKTKTTTTTPPQ